MCNTVEYVENRKMVSLAVSAQELPEQMNIDWSNAWEQVRSKIHRRPNMTSDELSLYLAIEFGSVVSYQVIEPHKLRAYCAGTPPTNPAKWPHLLQAREADIVRLAVVFARRVTPRESAGVGKRRMQRGGQSVDAADAC